MADKIEDGGPAFPVELQFSQGQAPAGIQTSAFSGWATGLTMRDWFAGQALIGLCQADMSAEQYAVSPDILARTAFRMADAMLAARKAGA